jgi:hypothetical protein
MPRFYVRGTFGIPDRKLYVMVGSIVEGEVSPGMFIQFPFSSSLLITSRIHSVEPARQDDAEDVRLLIESDPELADIIRGLDIRGEILEVTDHRLD